MFSWFTFPFHRPSVREDGGGGGGLELEAETMQESGLSAGSVTLFTIQDHLPRSGRVHGGLGLLP